MRLASAIVHVIATMGRQTKPCSRYRVLLLTSNKNQPMHLTPEERAKLRSFLEASIENADGDAANLIPAF